MVELKKTLLNRVAIVKLNGGLGITMGLNGPKSELELVQGKTFLDITIDQISNLNKKFESNVPLILMNSFNTSKITENSLNRYSQSGVRIITFNQRKFPRLDTQTLNPVATSQMDKDCWYPPGHGDIYHSLFKEGIAQKLLDEKRDIIFVSNMDNPGAILDLRILYNVMDKDIPFTMEITDRKTTDIRGGIILQDHVTKDLRLVELSQVPKSKLEKLDPVKFDFWNTNNIWVNLNHLKNFFGPNAEKKLEMDVIINTRTVHAPFSLLEQSQNNLNTNFSEDQQDHYLQLEIPAGSAIQNFPKAKLLRVDRSRYRVVKTTSDLMIAQSNIFVWKDGNMVMNPQRKLPNIPTIKWDQEFRLISGYKKRIPFLPNILHLDHLTVSGSVRFGKNVTLKGTVIIVATHGGEIHIPDGAILENNVVGGELNIVEH
eukprot:gnl/Spiro4/13701_TR7298_c0_g1_i1.p1 gnl/Spiro4/13701_TR7298_c0_g1~~gnl/Spiro4/13701_TR7298_c0_g1_i1.p1  ORF type:complete len:486 (-),score=-10.20 gnl/Spiro4/13701_TR7298_c0_g1_i1:4-1290(-)